MEQINIDHTFLVEHSETSDNRLFITSNISPETTPEEQTSNVVPQYTRHYSVQPEQEDLTNPFQNLDPHQLNPLYPQLSQDFDTQQLNPSETATIQNTSEFSEETIQTEQNLQSLTITNDSNLIKVPIHIITQDEINNQNQNDTLKITQDITQPSHTQASPRQNYDPPTIPPEYSTQTHTNNSPQQGSSNTEHTNIVHFQTPTPPSPSAIQTSTILQLKVIQYKISKLV